MNNEMTSVPDTLDLAEHARWALNTLLGHLEPESHYAVYQSFTFEGEPRLGGLTWNLPPDPTRHPHRKHPGHV